MGKSFRSDDLDQALLLPPSLHDWLPENHLAHFVAEVVRQLDLGAIYASYEEKDGRGQSAYAPEMMVRLLLYGYYRGTYSSRKIQAKTYEDLAFRFLAADEHPDHSTLAEFRKRHLQGLAGLFEQALRMCQKAGLVKLGHVAIAGTKIQGNASKHKAMSYERMNAAEGKLKKEVEELLRRAQAVDQAEDEQYGQGNGGTSCRPSWRDGKAGCRRFGRRRRSWKPKPSKKRNRKKPRRKPAWQSAGSKRRAWARS